MIEHNELARVDMTCHVELRLVTGATHLFEEPGALEEVARLALGWFDAHLVLQSESRTGPPVTDNLGTAPVT